MHKNYEGSIENFILFACNVKITLYISFSFFFFLPSAVCGYRQNDFTYISSLLTQGVCQPIQGHRHEFLVLLFSVGVHFTSWKYSTSGKFSVYFLYIFRTTWIFFKLNFEDLIQVFIEKFLTKSFFPVLSSFRCCKGGFGRLNCCFR